MKKILSIFVISFTFFSSLFSLPGFNPYIKDIPGEYVYYQDKTFSRESYVGFLTYDEKTYEARYFAPKNDKAKLPEKEVKVYFTLNPSADHVELTGEHISSGITQDDTEIVNYIHDMIYELTARRIKAGEIVPGQNTVEGLDFLHTGIRIDEDFPQFGGDVSIIYDFLVPLFNIKLIESNSAEAQFFVVTAGRVTSADDTAFDSFKGFPQKYSDKSHKFKKNKKAESKVFAMEDGQSVTLDTNWTQSMENLWLLGDAALISMGTIPENALVKVENSPEVSPFILRQLLLSNSTSYVDWKKIFIENYAQYVRNDDLNSSSYTVKTMIYQPSTMNLTKNIKIISKKENGYCFFTITAFDNVYRKNEKYFNDILKSYKN